ncbi:MAG: hypothetical protein ACR2HR_16300 [Euzebya sp.]
MSRRAARLFLLGLGAARLVEGLYAVVATDSFLRVLGSEIHVPGARAGFRMKSGRDVALGLLSLTAVGDDARLADLAMTTVVVDTVDAAAVLIDGRQAFGSPVFPAGAVLGLGVALTAAFAARSLRR